jgi:hypothetical protein
LVYNRAVIAWQVLFFSLLADPLLSQVPFHSIPLEWSAVVAGACGSLVLPFLAQNTIQQLLEQLRGADKKRTAAAPTIASYILIIGLALLASSKFLAGVAAGGFISLIFVTAVFASIAKTAVTLIRDQAKERKKFAENPILQIRRWEDQLFIFAIAPMLAARAVSFLGAIADARHIWERVPFWLTGAILLGMLRPQKRFFEGFCKRCKQPVPVVMVALGGCHRCDSKLRNVEGR